MIIKYRPDKGPAREFDFVPGDLESPEAEALEALGGNAWGTFEEFGALFFRGSQRARRAALWVCLHREQPRLKFTDVNVRVNQISVEYSAMERAAILEVMLADPNLDEDQRENLTRAVNEDLASDAQTQLAEAGVETDTGLPKDQPGTSDADASTSPPQA
jgi:hypothetical protein